MLWIVIALLAIIAIVVVIGNKRFKKVVKMFEDGSVSVFGMRGDGKDLLMSNVCAYRNVPYCSNLRYTKKREKDDLYIPYKKEYLQLGGNTFENFVSGNLKPYVYPLADGVDFYISDAGVFFPSQYNDKLNRMFPEIPLAQALLRHLGNANLHFNVQFLGRVWDKFREQSDVYIYCKRCRVLFGKFVMQRIYVYDKYESARDKVKPFNVKAPVMGKSVKYDVKLMKAKFEANYGDIKAYTLIYRNKSKYDSRRFKKILETGSFDED